jgi:thiamine biosynthesis protein ThiS
MRVEVNGEPRELEPGSTVALLLASLGLADRPVAVERNAEIVPRSLHASTQLDEGDRLELVQFVGGG